MKNFYIDESPGGVRYRLAYRDPLTGKAKRLSVSMDHHSIRNQRKAEEILQKRLAEVLGESSGDMLLSKAVEKYLAAMSAAWRSSTRDRNKSVLEVILRYFPDDAILGNISPQVWRDKIAEHCGENITKYNEYLKRIKAFLRWCFFNDILDVQIAEKLQNKAEKCKLDEKATEKVLESHEVPLLLDALRPAEHWHLLAQFMLLSGLRCGEALALDDVDVGEEYIRVNKTLNPSTFEIGPPKTAKSNRDVAITSELADLIGVIRHRNQWLKVSLGIRSDFFFFSENKGKRLRMEAFNKFLKEHSIPAIGKPITSHWLRHTHASFLLAAGIPIDMISRRLGHESVQITQRVYLHVIEKLKKRDADALRSVNLLGSPADFTEKISSISTRNAL